MLALCRTARRDSDFCSLRNCCRATGIRRVSRPGVKAKGLEEISRQSGRESASEIRTAPGSDPTTGWDTPAVGGSGDGVMKASDLSKLMSELRDLAFTTT